MLHNPNQASGRGAVANFHIKRDTTNRDDIGLSVAIKAEEGEWTWIAKVNVENDIELGTLIQDPRSSARQVIDRKVSSLFYGDKRTAAENKEYVYGPRDESYTTPGSIAVRDVTIRSESRVFLRAILSISTHGKQLCEQGNLNTQKKICELILPAFESRLRLELALHYIKHQMHAAPPTRPARHVEPAAS